MADILVPCFWRHVHQQDSSEPCSCCRTPHVSIWWPLPPPPPRLPCSLVLGIFPQGLVAVTVVAQVASVSALFSTPVLFFLPVARSHSPHAWKSYLHSPIEQREQTVNQDAFVLKGSSEEARHRRSRAETWWRTTRCSFCVCYKQQPTAISQRNESIEPEEPESCSVNGCLMSIYNLFGYYLRPIKWEVSRINRGTFIDFGMDLQACIDLIEKVIYWWRKLSAKRV